ncbi:MULTISPECIES: ribonuclease D [Pseudomonas]|uniref:ribonuclease D n=1 Tax=Pseudomonas TaxID=286 RepID=UPI00028A1E13|nr:MULTISPECIES: ribonuclease D [Pseudomonas]AMB78900.1 ribonuclease D [Pseudomonas fragi]MCB1654643.1 ribonuclease D [Pseudomonadales bacterium]MCH4870019.1 ribonuclease D [Pseudomonas sp. TMW22089]NBF14586.1 ribonuclease D [Pseudomonas sp. Fl4BN2]NBG91759.1 ribonuclease D [Pseudomonas sp. 9.1(2019)]NNG61317.1 ribonuclease D [Pseudomonas sp. GC01]
MAIDIHWIRDNDSLGQHCAEWQSLPFVALDTEFMRVDTFYPIAGLIQIGDGERAYLIDPLTIDNWQPLSDLLENPAVVKVLHACSEDLEVLLRLTGSLPAPLFDTQLAAAYLNLGFSMGYSRLVKEVLDLDLPKGETRSDWLQRPLSETQISYAAEDALHLAEVYVLLRPRLSDEKYAWVLEDGAELVANLRREVDPYEVYREAKLAWKLSPAQLAVLREICAWREQQARARDLPRNRVVREHALWPLAKTQPDNLVALARIEDMHPRTVRQDGEFLLDMIKRAASLPPEQWPPAVPEPLPVEAAALIKRLRAIGQAEAERLNIAPELMLRKKTLEALLKSGFPNGPYHLPDSLRGWRRELMGQALLDSLATAGEPS